MMNAPFTTKKLFENRLGQCVAATLFLVSPFGWTQEGETEEAAPQQGGVTVVQEDTRQASIDELERAYQKEFAFLEAQKRDLERRVESFRNQAQSETRQLQREINRLQERAIRLSSESERLNEAVFESELALQTITENIDVLEATFLQAETSLEDYGYETPPEDVQRDTALAETFEFGARTLQRLSGIREDQGTFYLTDGTEVEGELIHFGNIATFGVSDETAGALAPAGAGSLKLWPTDANETARALADGIQPRVLSIFLYETLTQAITETASKSMLEVIQSGGTIAWIIVMLGVIAAVLILMRVLFLRAASSRTESLTNEVGVLVEKGYLEDAIHACKKDKGATARVLAATVRNLDREREHLEDIISESILHENAHLNRFGAMILVIAAVSPLLGLLGTVTGMISTFDVITEFGTGDPKLLSGGISIALVTTEIGLIVAIPTLLFGNLLSGWADWIKDDMEKAALRITNVYEENRA